MIVNSLERVDSVEFASSTIENLRAVQDDDRSRRRLNVAILLQKARNFERGFKTLGFLDYKQQFGN